MSLAIVLAGIEVQLLAERALWLPQTQTLIVADLHWGKAAAFRAGGVPVPHGTTQSGLDRLDAVLASTGARHLYVLGDLLHARAGMVPETVQTLERWRAGCADVLITLVRGNHDYDAGDPPASLDIRCLDAPVSVGPFALCHHPVTMPDAFVLAGHVHPVVQLRSRGRQRLTLPCFAFTENAGVLPAFGEFTGGGVVDQRDFTQCFVIADNEVLPLPARSQLPYVTPG